MKLVRGLSCRIAVAVLLAGCGADLEGGPELGPLGGVATVPVRLAQESRPAVAAAEDGRFELDLRLPRGSMVLAFGWKTLSQDGEAAPTNVRVSFRGQDGSDHLLATAGLPPAGAGGEGWLQTILRVPDELAGRVGSIVYENDGAAAGRSIFSALPKPVPERGQRPNIILISIDTLRADRLGCYGHDRPTSPAIDAMAAQGARFANAFSQSPWTLPSHYTMLTSLYPSAHGVNPDRWQFAAVRGAHERFGIRGSGREETLAERLDALGYFTAAVTENGWVHSKFGFEQGFASYVDHNEHELREGTQPLTLRWLPLLRDLPFFLFVHTYEPHQPYDQPAPYDTMFVDPGHIGFARAGAPVTMETVELFRDRTFPPMPADVEAFRGFYDGEVRYVDTLIEALLAKLRELGMDRNTVVLFTSDHGEELFEHGNFDHGDTLYDEVMRVPFILWGPGVIPGGTTHDLPVGLIDVLPTLVEIAGGEVGGGVQGRSLVPLLAGGAEGDPRRVLYAEGFAEEGVPTACVWDGPDKLILYGRERQRAELFDLLADPQETRNLADQHPERVARLAQLIAGWQEGNRGIQEALGQATQNLDPEVVERLRALGYL